MWYRKGVFHLFSQVLVMEGVVRTAEGIGTWGWDDNRAGIGVVTCQACS